jgi:hypothetical protein
MQQEDGRRPWRLSRSSSRLFPQNSNAHTSHVQASHQTSQQASELSGTRWLRTCITVGTSMPTIVHWRSSMRHMRQCCSICKSQAPEATTCPPAACYGGHCCSIMSGQEQGFCMFWNTSPVATYRSHDWDHLEMLQVYRCLIIVHSKLICKLSFGCPKKTFDPTIQQ